MNSKMIANAYQDASQGTKYSGWADKDIVADGEIYNRRRDPPGQNCVYIPPGYHHREHYRLATFAQFPADVPAKVTDMAAAGFYFTGYKDRVKCFSCGIAVENWMLGDDGMDKKWHTSDCKMAVGQEERNISIPAPNFRTIIRSFFGKCKAVKGIASLNLGHRNYSQAPVQAGLFGSQSGSNDRPINLTDVTSNFGRVNLNDNFPALVLANIVDQDHENLLKSLNLKKEADRRKTFLKWPSYPAPYLPSDLAKEGYFYLGNLDRTQCFSCSGVLRNWAPYDNIREQHRMHFPDCRIVRLMDSGNIPLSEEEREEADTVERARIAALLPSAGSLVEPPDPSPEDQELLAQRYPCNDPVNPHMRRIEKRLDTFKQGWLVSKVRATPEQIAKAGFFYLGDTDKTKCFYCNGGLQNWDPNDEPWTEHAKWFPGCEFVIRSKGVEFVRRLTEAHPNLNRPYIRNPVSFDIPPRERQRTSPNQSMEPQQNIVDIPYVISMGFSQDRIQQAMQRRSRSGGFASTQDLIDDLLEENDEESNNNEDVRPNNNVMENRSNAPGGNESGPAVFQTGNKREATTSGSETITKRTRSTSPTETEQGLEENLREVERARICKNCQKNLIDMVLIPCGHFAVCSGCAPGVTRCPICKNKVSTSVKVYRA